MTALAWLLGVALGAAPVTELPARTRAVVLPLRVLTVGVRAVVEAAPVVERGFAVSLARHAGWEVVSGADLQALLGAQTRAEWVGCDAESCLAEMADALGSDLLVSLSLAVREGLWSLQASAMDRRTASVLRRSAVRTVSLEALLGSLDVLARQLAVGSQAAADDPRLDQRLGTTPAVAGHLRQEVREHPDQDVATTWTRLVVRSNRESGRLALLEGALLGGGGLALLLGATLHLAAVGMLAMPVIFGAAGDGLLQDLQSGQVSPEPRYPFPWLVLLVPLVVAPWPAVLLAATLAIPAAVAVVDAQDRGRIPVSAAGCCRDEEALERAEEPLPAERIAVGLALAGSVASALAGLNFFCSIFPLLLPLALWAALPVMAARDGVSIPYGPTTRLGGDTLRLVSTLVFLVPGLGYLALSSIHALVSLAAAAVLVSSARTSLVDPEPAAGAP